MSSQWVEKNTGLEARRADFYMNLMNNYAKHSTNSDEGVGLRYFLSLLLPCRFYVCLKFSRKFLTPSLFKRLTPLFLELVCVWMLLECLVPVLLGECTSSMTKSKAGGTSVFCLVYTMRMILFIYSADFTGLKIK